MDEVVHSLFALVCGQNPDHTWSCGGALLPCCQRCTGLYVGAAVATLLHLSFRPKATTRFLQAHGVCLLLMVPCGYHWLAQGPVLRTASGLLFGFGLVAYLFLPAKDLGGTLSFKRRIRQGSADPDGNRTSIRGLLRLAGRRGVCAAASAVMLGLVMLPSVGMRGGAVAHFLISSLAVSGLCSLGALVMIDLLLIGSGVFHYATRMLHRVA